MKGLELPVNVLVVVAVAVIVLLGVIGLYFAGVIPGFQTITLASAKTNACSALINRGCGSVLASSIPVNYDVNSDGVIDPASNPQNDNLLQLCITKFGVTDDSSADLNCKRNVCGCSI